jgi:thioesterase domain-containing protein
MARQLTAMGKQVKMLAMFDAYAHNEKEEDPAALKLKRKILRQFPKMLFITGSLLRQPIPTIKYQAEFVRSKLNAMLGDNAETNEEIAMDPKIYERYEYAFRNYELKPYDGVIDVFKVNTRLYFLDDPKYLGWKDWAGKGVRVHNIPGDHKTFIMVPHNKEFANILQDALDSVKIA